MANNTTQNNGKNLRHCSFCGRNEQQVNFLIPSPTGLYICDFCVDTCADFENVYWTKAGCTVSCHCGPGTLGVLFVRK